MFGQLVVHGAVVLNGVSDLTANGVSRAGDELKFVDAPERNPIEDVAAYAAR